MNYVYLHLLLNAPHLCARKLPASVQWELSAFYFLKCSLQDLQTWPNIPADKVLLFTKIGTWVHIEDNYIIYFSEDITLWYILINVTASILHPRKLSFQTA